MRGKVSSHAPRACIYRDHPRVCGEKSKPATVQAGHKGSPPRMRGKDFPHSFQHFHIGITPAYAGKRSISALGSPAFRDHPRVCGEKFSFVRSFRFCLGSPPRMRGKGTNTDCAKRTAGITPAYAGKSTRLSFFSIISRDHPRVCGEKTKKIPSHRPFQLHPVPVSFSFA